MFLGSVCNDAGHLLSSRLFFGEALRCDATALQNCSLSEPRLAIKEKKRPQRCLHPVSFPTLKYHPGWMARGSRHQGVNRRALQSTWWLILCPCRGSVLLCAGVGVKNCRSPSLGHRAQHSVYRNEFSRVDRDSFARRSHRSCGKRKFTQRSTALVARGSRVADFSNVSADRWQDHCRELECPSRVMPRAPERKRETACAIL